MKKLKYILSFLIIMGGLFISTFSFSQNLDNVDIVESHRGSLFTWSDSVINSNITNPIFMWLGSFINAVLDFWPVICIIIFFWLIYGAFKGLLITKKDNNKKSLDNK